MHSRRFQGDFVYRIVLPLLLATMSATWAIGAEAQIPAAIPDTPAGKQLAAFLAAFNTGKRAAIKEFIDSNFDKPPNVPAFVDNVTDQDFQLYRQSHGFTVRKIQESASAMIKAQA